MRSEAQNARIRAPNGGDATRAAATIRTVYDVWRCSAVQGTLGGDSEASTADAIPGAHAEPNDEPAADGYAYYEPAARKSVADESFEPPRDESTAAGVWGNAPAGI